jgi:hypothetical protein
MILINTTLTTAQRDQLTTRKATLMPLREPVSVIIDTDEKIFDENFCYAISSMNRIIKVRKEALSYGS